MVWISMLMGSKAIVVCNNNDHLKVVQGLLADRVGDYIHADNAMFTPADKGAELEKLKPDRLVCCIGPDIVHKYESILNIVR